MSHVTVDFNKLKFNLYQVLGVDKNADDVKIKKAFRKLIINFHPDKNSENNIEEDVYFHIVTANQILTNKENRERYDSFISQVQNTHDDLKKNFNELSKDDLLDKSKEECEGIFANKFKELEKKHLKSIQKNIDEDNDIDKLKNKYNQLLQTRSAEINIIKENFVNEKDFNSRFEDRLFNNDFTDQLVPIDVNMDLSTYNVNSNYTLLDIAYGDDNLYVKGGGITTSSYSDLDSAFKLQPIIAKNFKEKNIEDQIKEYKAFTDNLTNIEYNKEDKFELW
jgi:curved DNA-binding protein CbpA